MADTDFDFEILETLALRDGGFIHLQRHVTRMQDAARHFGRPCTDAVLEQALQQLRQAHASGHWRVRLALEATGRIQTQAAPLPPSATPVRLALADRPIANAVARGDWVRFKTSRRAHYDSLQPTDASVFDTVLHNEDGEITEGTRGNIAVLLAGRWVTRRCPAACCRRGPRGGAGRGPRGGAPGAAGRSAARAGLGLRQQPARLAAGGSALNCRPGPRAELMVFRDGFHKVMSDNR